MDVAAQQVQRQVQHIADECDDDEGDHVAGGGAQHIEHLGQHCAGQHQRHQPDVGQDITEETRHAVVHRRHEARYLAEALFAPARAVYQHKNARDQHHRHAGYTADAKHRKTRARQNDPPGDLVKQGIHKAALFAFFHHADGHAGEHLQGAQDQRAHHDGHGVVQG